MKSKPCFLTPYIEDIWDQGKNGQKVVSRYIWYCGRFYDDIKENHFYKKYLESFDTAPLYRMGKVLFPKCLKRPDEQDLFLRLVVSCISIHEYQFRKEDEGLVLSIIPAEDGPAFPMHEPTTGKAKALFRIILCELLSIAALDSQCGDDEPRDVLEKRREFFDASVIGLAYDWNAVLSEGKTD